MHFSVQFFTAGEEGHESKYRSLIEIAKFADAHDFTAVWLPERHFTKVGCLFPNPATLHAALARETSRIRLRAGSVVLPLHDTKRVAEEWAVVDNLSNGRVDVSFAVGWHPDDFSFHPDRFESRYESFPQAVRTVQRLWRGDHVPAVNGLKATVSVRTYPTPVQSELPTWITASGDPRTFRQAGLLGANLLTHLLTQSLDELAQKLEIYRSALSEVGVDPQATTVTVMLHTHVHTEAEVCPPFLKSAFRGYLHQSGGELVSALKSSQIKQQIPTAPSSEFDDGIDLVVRRLVDNRRVLFGNVRQCAEQVRFLETLGVNEIACQLDFGIENQRLMEGLIRLNTLRESYGKNHILAGRSRRHLKDGPLAIATASETDLAAAKTRCVERLPRSQFRQLLQELPDVADDVVEIFSEGAECLIRIVSDHARAENSSIQDTLCNIALLAAAVTTRNFTSVSALSAIGEYRVTSTLTDAVWFHCKNHSHSGNPPRISVSAYDDGGAIVATLTEVELSGVEASNSCAKTMMWIPTWSRLQGLPPQSQGQRSQDSGWWDETGPQFGEQIDQYQRVKPSLDRLSYEYILDALETLGVRLEYGALISLDDIIAHTGISGYRQLLLRKLVDLLVVEGTLVVEPIGFRVSRAPRQMALGSSSEVSASSEINCCRPEFDLLSLCGPRLADVLKGEVSGLEVLFSPRGLHTLRNFYSDAALSSIFNEKLADALAAEISFLPPNCPIRILELGAGTGATTSRVISRLNGRDVVYCVTDVSPFFVGELQGRFSGHRGVTVRTLDIEREPFPQGFEPRSFDFVIASNVLHATADIRASLKYASQLLTPAGRLLLTETTSPEPALDITFGMLPGWWRFTDTDLRSHPLLSRSAWCSVLQSMGFAEVNTWPPDMTTRRVSATIISAQCAMRPPFKSDVTRGHYVALCDDVQMAAAIRLRFRDCGQEVLILPPALLDGHISSDTFLKADSPTSAHDYGMPSHDPRSCAGVIYIVDSGKTEEEAILTIPRRLLQLTKGLLSEQGGLNTRICVATLGAHDVNGVASTEQMLACGSLSGFVRALRAALGERAIRLIDLDPNAPPTRNAASLCACLELDGPTLIAIRENSVYAESVARVERSNDTVGSMLLVEKATYLITGSLGGLGSHMAFWLAERGARHLVLVSRPEGAGSDRTKNASRKEKLRSRLLKFGTLVKFIDVDVRDELALSLAVQQLSADECPPIRGVIHTAGTWTDRPIRAWTSDEFEESLKAKAWGAYVLHKMFKSVPLDFFILFSSLSSFFPSPEQASYATANAFQDALSAFRRKSGLPAVSIGWGPWAEIGYGATPKGRALHAILAENGIDQLNATEAANLVEEALKMDGAIVAVARIDSQRLLHNTLSWLRGTHELIAQIEPNAILPVVSCPPATIFQDEESICDLLLAELKLLVPNEVLTISKDVVLSTLGLDSLSSLQFTTRLRSRFGATLSLEDADTSTTVRQLARLLLSDTNNPNVSRLKESGVARRPSPP